eukprot:778852-Rhodomonas_salina.1
MEALPTITESGATAVINFPDPGKLDGVKSRSKPILELKNLTFFYPSADKPTLENVNAKMTVMSRVALLGPNGAGLSPVLRCCAVLLRCSGLFSGSLVLLFSCSLVLLLSLLVSVEVRVGDGFLSVALVLVLCLFPGPCLGLGLGLGPGPGPFVLN